MWQSPGVERRLTTSDEDLMVWWGVVWQSPGVERRLTTSNEDLMAWQNPVVIRRLTTSVEDLVVWRGWWYDSASSEGFVYASLPVWAGAECGKVPGKVPVRAANMVKERRAEVAAGVGVGHHGGCSEGCRCCGRVTDIDF